MPPAKSALCFDASLKPLLLFPNQRFKASLLAVVLRYVLLFCLVGKAVRFLIVLFLRLFPIIPLLGNSAALSGIYRSMHAVGSPYRLVGLTPCGRKYCVVHDSMFAAELVGSSWVGRAKSLYDFFPATEVRLKI